MKNPPLLGLNIVLSRMNQPMWNATPQQYADYKDTEVFLCLAARDKNPKLKQDDTLFSQHTWDRATAHLKYHANCQS